MIVPREGGQWVVKLLQKQGGRVGEGFAQSLGRQCATSVWLDGSLRLYAGPILGVPEGSNLPSVELFQLRCSR